MAPASVNTPTVRKMARGEKCHCCANNQCAPEAAKLPTNEHQFAAAKTSPLDSRAGLCCNNAAIGTMKNPPLNPSNARNTNAFVNVGWGNASKEENSDRPTAPSGTRPYSIFPPDKYPAETLPKPIPKARATVR